MAVGFRHGAGTLCTFVFVASAWYCTLYYKYILYIHTYIRSSQTTGRAGSRRVGCCSDASRALASGIAVTPAQLMWHAVGPVDRGSHCLSLSLSLFLISFRSKLVSFWACENKAVLCAGEANKQARYSYLGGSPVWRLRLVDGNHRLFSLCLGNSCLIV